MRLVVRVAYCRGVKNTDIIFAWQDEWRIFCRRWQEIYKAYLRDIVRGVLIVSTRLKLPILRGHHCTSQSDAVSPYCTEIHRQPYLNLHSEYPTVRNSGACYCSPVILITANTAPFTCGEALTYSQDRPNVLYYQFSDAIDRKSSGEYPQSKPHENRICAACLAISCSAVRLAMCQAFK
jgi:hypothetical protein